MGVDLLPICGIFVCMDKPELMDMWILKHPSVTDPSLPDCVCFERYAEVGTLGVHSYEFRVCQYSSAQPYAYDEVPTDGIFHKPVNMWRGDVEAARNIWEMFMADGWKPVDTYTPEGCAKGGMHFSACKYREAVSTMYSRDHWSGAYPDPEVRSDLARDFYLVCRYPDGIESFHPVTRMPRIPHIASRQRRAAQRRSRRVRFTVQVPAANTSQTDNYALGA